MDERATVGGSAEVDTMALPDEMMEDVAVREARFPLPRPVLPPILLQASGLYECRHAIGLPVPLPIQPVPQPFPNLPQPGPAPTAPAVGYADGTAVAAEQQPEPSPELALGLALLREDLRLDVDGRTPLMMASGTQYFRIAERLHWIARLRRFAPDGYMGPIWYKDGAVASFPYTVVRIDVTRSAFPPLRAARVTFLGPGVAARVVRLRYVSPFFRPVELEYDCAEGTEATLDVITNAHPNRPATLPAERLTIDTVFRRAGFHVRRTGGDDVVPLSLAGADARWTDAEMHDAMQVYWSRFDNKAQWSLWSFFASLHVWGPSLGGIMFDDIGPNHRQGCATFVDSFIKNPPADDPKKDAWVPRMIFWTAVHEMGHCFNLAHSWQKALGTPWIPLANEPEARSFMNYPFRVTGGQKAFFADFEYRFSDGELLFMRHAPARFVRMGDADWFDHHGFEQAAAAVQPGLRLELRVNREKPVFEFLEPLMLELKLKNITGEPRLVDERILRASDHLTLVVKRQTDAARVHSPFARYCFEPKVRVLGPGESIYDAIFAAAGTDGWLVAEPGDYVIQAALRIGDEDVVSNRIRVRIRPPRDYTEEALAQDVFTEDVGRVLAFDGSRILDSANAALRELVERLPDRRAAVHARIALAEPLTRRHKVLDLHPVNPDVLAPASAAQGGIRPVDADPERARKELEAALIASPDVSAETLGHVEFNEYATRLGEWLAGEGERERAGEIAEELLLTLSARGVIESVLAPIRERAAALGRKMGNGGSGKSPRGGGSRSGDKK